MQRGARTRAGMHLWVGAHGWGRGGGTCGRPCTLLWRRLTQSRAPPPARAHALARAHSTAVRGGSAELYSQKACRRRHACPVVTCPVPPRGICGLRRINNAGSNGYRYGPLLESTDEALEEIVETNVLGVMLSCREAIRVMRSQPSAGHVFNMDGAGADGNATPRFAAYGATKRSLAQLGKSLNAELKMQVRGGAGRGCSVGGGGRGGWWQQVDAGHAVALKGEQRLDMLGLAMALEQAAV